jgi:hypothetical protein
MKTAAKRAPAQARHSPADATSAALPLKWPEHESWLRKLQSLVFFTVLYLCLWKWVDVHLIYHGGGVVRGFPVFFWGTEFARETWRYPGGLAEYVSALLAQSLFHSWWGGLLLTLQAWVILEAYTRYLRELNAKRFAIAAFIAPLMLVSLYARYKHSSVQITTLAVVSVALGLYLEFATVGSTSRIIGLLLLTVAVYVAAPAGLIMFTAAVMVFDLRQRSSWPVAVLVLVSAAVLSYIIGFFGYGLGVSEIFERLLPFRAGTASASRLDRLVVWTLNGLLPLLGAIVLLWKAFIAPRLTPAVTSPARQAPPSTKPVSQKKETHAKVTHGKRWPVSINTWAVETAFLVLLIPALTYAIHQRSMKAFLTVDYNSWQQKWEEVLAAVPNGARSFSLESAAAQASSHTGDLTRVLPRLNSAEEILLTQQGPAAYWRRSDLYYDLGYVNMALHLLIESGEFWGERPMILQRLAIVNFALGNSETGKLYLHALLKVPFFSSWARDYLSKIEGDPALERDPEVSRLRSLMMKSDSVVRTSAEEELLALLAANPQNLMAFEFLMTHCLLKRDLAGFAKNLPRMKNFPALKLGSLWDEALVLAAHSNPVSNLYGFVPSPEAERRFDTIKQVVRACGDDKELARHKLHDDFGQSYFYYYVFGR